MEQDTAKTNTETLTTHKRSYIDFNRSSIPLIEIITPPVLTSAHQAATAFAKIIEILRATETSTADLHHGAMRCDVNISLGLNSPRTEVKNLNSVRAVREACLFEIAEQTKLYLNPETRDQLVQSTKTFRDGKTITLRTKHGEKDYRYFLRCKGFDLGICLMRIYLPLNCRMNLFRRPGIVFLRCQSIWFPYYLVDHMDLNWTWRDGYLCNLRNSISILRCLRRALQMVRQHSIGNYPSEITYAGL